MCLGALIAGHATQKDLAPKHRTLTPVSPHSRSRRDRPTFGARRIGPDARPTPTAAWIVLFTFPVFARSVVPIVARLETDG
jgi:hypothetical protein